MTGRGSKLSLLQMEKVKQRIKALHPGALVQFIVRESRGDVLQDIPLHTVEGSDFFTRDIYDALASGDADIAVHSLKDMSSEHFFGGNKFAVIDRDDTRDLAIFNHDIEEKIRRGEEIIIGTCSPRREEMATSFLRKALPQLQQEIKISTKSIRGNVETRLRKLSEGEYDGTILATAGLNRLLAGCPNEVRAWLADKKLMLLPLIECAPAPCQGAIVAEANPANEKAGLLLQEINNTSLMQACIREKEIAKTYGVGCLQRFGVTSIQYGQNTVVYAAGKDSEGTSFQQWIGLPELSGEGKKIFSSTDVMGKFFTYEYLKQDFIISENIVYVANYKAVKDERQLRSIRNKQVWAAGTKTWFELAKKRIWVQGSADAFGLESLLKPWQMPLYNIDRKDVAILTHEQAVGLWQKKKWNAYATYRLLETGSSRIEDEVKNADIIFWTSFRQYFQYKHMLKEDVQHSCSYGETAEQLKEAGINPVIFPNIKAFLQWRQNSTR